MSVRGLRLLDAPRQALPGRLPSRDLARTLDYLVHGPDPISSGSIARWSMAPVARRTVVLTHGAAIDAVAVLRPRSGVRSWEVAHLYANDRGLASASELMDACAARVAVAGGERLFLRTDPDGALARVAHAAGFVPLYAEDIYRTTHPLARGLGGTLLRPTAKGDAHGLFRLYNAVVPTPVRAAEGMTFEQWRDSVSTPIGKARAYVRDGVDALSAWLRLAHSGEVLVVEALLGTADMAASGALIADAGRLAWGHAQAAWLVPSYQPHLGSALRNYGAAPRERFAVSARSTAKTVVEPALAMAKA